MRRNLPDWLKVVMLIVVFVFVAGGWSLLLYQEERGIQVTHNRGDYVRLHILANSDSPKDQELKLKVRDAVIAYLTPYVKDVSDAQAANGIITAHQDDIVRVAQQTLADSGMFYPVVVQMGTFEFPVRSYGSLVLPAGEYQAVRILIGQAEGQNWWCVLFPPLCFIDGANTALAPINAPQDGKSTDQSWVYEVKVRWKLAELWNK